MWATASQSHRLCVADSSSSRHLSQMGSLANPNLKRCPFRWQCPGSSPTTHLKWSLFNFNRSFVLLEEGPSMSPFASLSPVVDSQYSLWFLLVQSLTAFLATPTEIPQAGSGPMNGCSDPVFANWSAISYPTMPACPGHSYQLNPVMSGQLHEGLAAVPDQFWGGLVLVKCFNCCLTVRQNIYFPILVVPIYILICACFNGIHFCLEYCRVLPKAET
jgi:hypothetical protein